MKTIRFNQAFVVAAEATISDKLPETPRPLVVRDVYGRLRFAINAERKAYPTAATNHLEKAMEQLGAFGAPGGVLFRDDFADAEALFNNADWHDTVVPGTERSAGSASTDIVVRLLDRQIVGQDWLHADQTAADRIPPRIVFFGLKGGVGRSTALAMLAYRLARDGKKVLLLDFDLESPGLSGLLLPPERVATFGLVDWFVEDAVGQGDEVLGDLVSDSPLANATPGAIRVAAAMGQEEPAYLAKLARVYADVPSPTGATRFSGRMKRITELLEAREKPDVVLIDSRAGLTDLAAISIGALASVALLFATDSAQTWQGYHQLFAHWQQRPDVLRHVRSRLAIVQALFPETDQVDRAERFLQHSYDLFATTVYDQIEPGSPTPLDSFSFDLGNQDAPHFPLRVRWSARIQEFNPLIPVEKGGIGDPDIDLAFGPFFDEAKAMVFAG